MSHTALALLGYISWTLLLLVTLGGLRTGLVMSNRRAANSFSPTGEDVSPFSARLCRAHANCYESFPMFGGILLVAIALGQTPVTDGLALAALGARIGQSVAHLISTAVLAVQVRFAFFIAQIVIWVIWLVRLFSGV